MCYYLLQSTLYVTDLYEEYIYSYNMDTLKFKLVSTHPDEDGRNVALALHSQTSQPTYTGNNQHTHVATNIYR